MTDHKNGAAMLSRRQMMKQSVALLTAAAAGGALGACSTARPAGEGNPAAPPLPWKWTMLDPLEAGRRAYQFYGAKGGCGSASYLAFLSLLQEKVGYPYTTLPEMLMLHAAAGYGGHGTLCGTLAGTSLIINLVACDPKSSVSQQMIDRLFYWYADQEFPTGRFDDLSSMPGQVKVRAMSPLCHTSVSKWTLAAGAEVTSKAKKERCAKVAGEVVYTATLALNDYFEGKWTPPVWHPSKATEHCVQCHGPDDPEHATEGMNNQMGHMECLMCHADHTT